MKRVKVFRKRQVFNEVKRLIDWYLNEELSITIVGHSLGGCLAIISAYDIAEIGLDLCKDGHVIPFVCLVFKNKSWEY